MNWFTPNSIATLGFHGLPSLAKFKKEVLIHSKSMKSSNMQSNEYCGEKTVRESCGAWCDRCGLRFVGFGTWWNGLRSNKPKNVTQLSQRRRYLLVLCSAVYIGATTLFRIRFQFCSLLCRGLSPRKFSCHTPAGRRTVVLPNSKAASNRDREARGTDAHSIV